MKEDVREEGRMVYVWCTYGHGIDMITSVNSNSVCNSSYSILTSHLPPFSDGQQFTRVWSGKRWEGERERGGEGRRRRGRGRDKRAGVGEVKLKCERAEKKHTHTRSMMAYIHNYNNYVYIYLH